MAVLFAAAAGFVYLVVSSIMAPTPTQQKRVQQISLVMPPPPPPPVEQPPEPEIEEKVETPDPPPEPAEADAPTSPDLGVDADGSGSGDGFGLVGKKGGRDLLDGGPYAFYKGVLVSDIKAAIDEDRRLRRQPYRVTLSLWIGRDGRIERIELDGTTGDRVLDGSLHDVLAELRRVREVPPLEMPQPVKLRIVSRL